MCNFNTVQLGIFRKRGYLSCRLLCLKSLLLYGLFLATYLVQSQVPYSYQKYFAWATHVKLAVETLVQLMFSVGVLAAVSIAAFMGHLFPIFFGFKGGKGVATAIGVFIALSWKLVLVFAITWGLVAAISRYSSLAAQYFGLSRLHFNGTEKT